MRQFYFARSFSPTIGRRLAAGDFSGEKTSFFTTIAACLCSQATRPGRSTLWSPPQPNPYLPLDLLDWDAESWLVEWLDQPKRALLLDAQIAQLRLPTAV